VDLCAKVNYILYIKGGYSFIIENYFERFLHVFNNLIMIDLNVKMHLVDLVDRHGGCTPGPG
jgi:hypothetical protein